MKKLIPFVLLCVLFISKNVSATRPGESRPLKIKAKAVKKNNGESSRLAIENMA